MRTSPLLAPCLAAFAGLAAFGMAGCRGPRAKPESTGTVHSPDLTGKWTLQSLGSDEVASLLPADARPPSLSIAGDGAVTGFAGVNQLGTRFDADAESGSEPLFASIVTTKMAGPEPLMSLEYRFTDALTRTTRASIEAGNLALYDDAGALLATLAPTDR